MDNLVFINTMTEPKGGVYSAPVIIMIISIAVVIILLVGLVFGLVSSIKNTSLSLTNRELIIKTMFYGRKIPLENVMVDEIRAINLNEEPEYNITLKLNGTGLPNAKLGWMRLQNGMKALTCVTDTENVVLIPTKDYVILFSMSHINEFIDNIKYVTR
ncbi:MAG: PH domain-containing protein [Treponema sp.]|jgi:hypothetical protein|nr:PH domain-containing protein [Treponema sp.]